MDAKVGYLQCKCFRPLLYGFLINYRFQVVVMVGGKGGFYPFLPGAM
jgi:hypothetical protein